MAGLNIPGVTDQYNTNDTIEKLMKVERIPLTREQKQLETLKSQKEAWRDVNTHLSSLRDKTKGLYSFENPFNSKITSSTEENSITAEANRSAEIQSFKVDVIQAASADRFMSDELSGDIKVPSGMYTYKVGEKQVNINWKGGSLKDFSEAINKRGNGVIKALIIGASGGKKSLIIESQKTGKENKLQFENAAKDFAFSSGMIHKVTKAADNFASSKNEFTQIQNPVSQENLPKGMPQLSLSNVKDGDGITVVEPRGAFEVAVPQKVLDNANNHIAFTIGLEDIEDITEELNQVPVHPELPGAGNIEYEGIIVNNMPSDAQLNIPQLQRAPLTPVESNKLVYAVFKDGSEQVIDTALMLKDGKIELDIPLKDYADIAGIAVKNENTGKNLNVSNFSVFDPTTDLGYGPTHPVSEADDAIIKYEGITIRRPDNKIDDVVPEITLNVHDKTDKTATISVKPDKEASKDALIEFVGEYNQTVAKINILSQNKPEIVQELSYLSDDEKKSEMEKLGMFQTDFSLTSIKSTMQSIISSRYASSDYADVTMLSQIGISTNASGTNSGYSESRLRGYLEIDEKKLDEAIDNNLDDIKAIFGYDSDGDLIVDSGIAYRLDKQLSAYTQTGGILANKTSTLDSQIKTSENKIAKLEAQMDDKEAELRNKYSQMEGSLNSLESQQNSISNFSKQQNRSN